jgi:hypothetical protein
MNNSDFDLLILSKASLEQEIKRIIRKYAGEEVTINVNIKQLTVRAPQSVHGNATA